MDDAWLVLVAWAVAVLLMLLGWQGARLEWDDRIEFLDEVDILTQFDSQKKTERGYR